MTFLELCKRLRQKVGGAGTGPVTTAGQTGELKDYVDWVQEAWLLIQAEEANWRWMRKDFSFNTTVGKNFYLPSATPGETGVVDLADWSEEDSVRCYRTATGRTDETFVTYWDYQSWRDTFDFGSQPTNQSKPTVWSRRRADNAILLGETPNDVYTVTGQYQAAPSEMADDASVPGLPPRFHLLIVYRAMMLYGKFEAAPEVLADGEDEFDKMYAALRIDQLDQLSLGQPLA